MRVTEVIPKPLPIPEWERFRKITVQTDNDRLLIKLPQHRNGKVWNVQMDLAIKQVPSPEKLKVEGAETNERDLVDG